MGATIVLVVVVLGIVVFRGTFRDTPEYQPDDIDLLEFVASVQQLGLEPVYPPALPAGWSTKAASYEEGERPSVDLVFTTEDEHTAGVHRADEAASDLLDTYVGEATSENGDTLTTALGTWTGWDDSADDDHAWTTEIAGDSVLVYSSGEPDSLRTFVQSLTTAPVTP